MGCDFGVVRRVRRWWMTRFDGLRLLGRCGLVGGCLGGGLGCGRRGCWVVLRGLGIG